MTMRSVLEYLQNLQKKSPFLSMWLCYSITPIPLIATRHCIGDYIDRHRDDDNRFGNSETSIL